MLWLELARFKAFGHDLRIFTVKLGFIFGIDLLFFPGDDDGFFFGLAVVVRRILFDVLRFRDTVSCCFDI